MPKDAPFYKLLEKDRQKAILRLLVLPLPPALREAVQKLRADYLLENSEENRLSSVYARQMLRAPAATMRARLRDKSPLMRSIALEVIAKRRLPLEGAVIECLADPDQAVRRRARLALLCLSRGIDFGPPEEASQRAVGKWKHWLALQESRPTEGMAQKAEPQPAASSPDFVDPQQAMSAILTQSKAVLHNEDAETAALVKELTEAKSGEQAKVIERLQSGKGVQYSDALALAIPRLQGDLREQARQALARRFSRMKASTLRDKLHEDDAEVRRAAAQACVLKTAVEHVEDLIELLNDPEPAVVEAAHEALCKLTTVDHGPAAGATARQRREAVRAWRDWLRRRDHIGR